MSALEQFKAASGPGRDCRSISLESADRYRDLLPAALLEEWDQAGLCSYIDGFFWLVDPSELADVLEDWVDPEEGFVVFGRTALADLLLWNKQGVHVLHTQYGEIAFLTKNLELYFNRSLTKERYLNNALDLKIYRAALPDLGPLTKDECFGYEPILALGGEPSPLNLRKVRVREYLGILAQAVY